MQLASTLLSELVLKVTWPILSVLSALIAHSELKSVHPGFPVAFIFKHKLVNK